MPADGWDWFCSFYSLRRATFLCLSMLTWGPVVGLLLHCIFYAFGFSPAKICLDHLATFWSAEFIQNGDEQESTAGWHFHLSRRLSSALLQGFDGFLLSLCSFYLMATTAGLAKLMSWNPHDPWPGVPMQWRPLRGKIFGLALGRDLHDKQLTCSSHFSHSLCHWIFRRNFIAGSLSIISGVSRNFDLAQLCKRV